MNNIQLKIKICVQFRFFFSIKDNHPILSLYLLPLGYASPNRYGFFLLVGRTDFTRFPSNPMLDWRYYW